MPTTTNFGWTTPADTDLVKDGASAMRTLGNGIDTSLVYLKGGTTGQILSKTSNTDMAFTWINNDQGDITGVTAGTGLSGGGTSGAVSLAIDTATTVDKTTAQTLTNKTMSGSSNTFSNISLTSSVTGTLPIGNGGTNLTTYTTGDLPYASAANTLSKLAIGTTGQVLTVSGGVPSWATPSSGSTFIGCDVRTNTDTSIANTTWTAIPMEAADYIDSNDFHSTTTNNSRITIPTGKGGKYRIFGHLGWYNSATMFRAAIYLNGVQNIVSIGFGNGSYYGFVTVEKILDLAAGDYVQLYGYQESGGAVSINGNGPGYTHFSATYLGA